MKAVVEERVPSKKYSGTEGNLIKEYKRKSYAIKRAKKESIKRDNEVDIRIMDDHYELKQHKIFRNGECVHSVSQ